MSCVLAAPHHYPRQQPQMHGHLQGQANGDNVRVRRQRATEVAGRELRPIQDGEIRSLVRVVVKEGTRN